MRCSVFDRGDGGGGAGRSGTGGGVGSDFGGGGGDGAGGSVRDPHLLKWSLCSSRKRNVFSLV